MEDLRTIDFGSSPKWSFDDVDEDAKKLHLNRSKFIQFIYDYWKTKKKYDEIISYVTMLLGCCAVLLLILLVIYR